MNFIDLKVANSTKNNNKQQSLLLFMRAGALLFAFMLVSGFLSCQENQGHTAPAVRDRDSASMMVTYGVNTMISDSGVMRYRMIAERWEVNTVRHPSFWLFDKGLYLQQYDDKFHIQAFAECDTAWYYDKLKLWELRGRVKLRTTDGTRFSSEELYWDQQKHEIYSNMYSHLITPDNEMEGTRFYSREPDNQGHLTKYSIDNTKGWFTPDKANDSKQGGSMRDKPDSVKQQTRPPITPIRGFMPDVTELSDTPSDSTAQK